jgi:hypothetical protein
MKNRSAAAAAVADRLSWNQIQNLNNLEKYSLIKTGQLFFVCLLTL